MNAGRAVSAAMRSGTGPSDVLVVGGGVIGLSLARELAGSGARVALLERGTPGGEASWAAAGMLVPRSFSADAGPFFDLRLESHRLYPSWIRELEEETGQTVGYRQTGSLRCCLDDSEEAELARFSWQAERGLPFERWNAAAVAAALGSDSPAAARAALYFPDEGVVDPRRLTAALEESARRRGVRFQTGTARRFAVSGGRCLGVETDAERLEATQIVDACGAWAAFDESLPFDVPVEPIRGQIVELALRGGAPEWILECPTVYVAPHGGERALLGSTHERVGFDKRVTAGAVGGLIAEAAKLWPAVSSARFVTAWSGLRPGTADGLPILGGSPVEGLFFAAGHYRNGILLAPATARRLAAILAGGRPEELSPFSITRFSPGGRSGPHRDESFAPERFQVESEAATRNFPLKPK